MADDILGKQLETLFGMPPGSMSNISLAKDTPLLVSSVNNKTKDLSKQLKTNDMLTSMPTAELVKTGISLDQLEDDRKMLRNEAFEVYRIGRALLNKLYSDLENQIGVNDRMWASAAKMLDSVNGSVMKLFDMNQKLKQDEEFRVIASNNPEDDGKTKNMTTEDWMAWVEAAKESEEPVAAIEQANVVDADIK